MAIKKWGAGIHPISIAAVPMGITALLMGVLALAFERGPRRHTSTPLRAGRSVPGPLGSAFPFTIYFWLLKHQTATSMSLINYATPVIAVTVGTLFMSEPFTSASDLGSALVLVGVGVTLRKKKVKAEG